MKDSIETGQNTPLGGRFHAASETASEAATALARDSYHGVVYLPFEALVSGQAK
jgi:hypothetical protein